ncbi:unnamed protein product [Ceratitis capitata]|uniref:Cyclin-dependent kinases regulatory subunit n=2 Tax=Ceratitis capitata TaxID=7213 RepID=A0A811UEU5_CERCA|nr:unnamed protein product [Ceratitis capitata]
MTIGDAVVLVNRVGCRKHTHKLLIEVFRSFTTRRTTTAIIFLIRIYVAANKISSSNGVINNWCLVYVNCQTKQDLQVAEHLRASCKNAKVHSPNLHFQKNRVKRSVATMSKDIYYSDKYYDEKFEYRHVVLPKELVKLVPKTHLMSEAEWRSIGVQQSRGWIHYMVHKPEPHILLFRRPIQQ